MPLIDLKEDVVPQKIVCFTLTQDFLFDNRLELENLFKIPEALGLKGKWTAYLGDGDFWRRDKVLIIEGDRHVVEPMIHHIMSLLRP